MDFLWITITATTKFQSTSQKNIKQKFKKNIEYPTHLTYAQKKKLLCNSSLSCLLLNLPPCLNLNPSENHSYIKTLESPSNTPTISPMVVVVELCMGRKGGDCERYGFTPASFWLENNATCNCDDVIQLSHINMYRYNRRRWWLGWADGHGARDFSPRLHVRC